MTSARTLRGALYFWVCLWDVGAWAYAQPNERCYSLNQIVQSLPTYPENLFFKDARLRLFLTGALGLTTFTAEQLKALEIFLLQQGEPVGKALSTQVEALQGAPSSSPDKLTLIKTRRRVAVSSPGATPEGLEANAVVSPVVQGWFLRRHPGLEGAVDQEARQGVHAIHDWHDMPLPNREALAAYWAGQPTGSQHLVGLGMLDPTPGKESARMIRLPVLIAKEFHPDFVKDRGFADLPQRTFALDAQTFVEEGITPELFTQVRVDVESNFFPVQMLLATAEDNRPIYVPYPFPASRPIRTLEMTQAKLREWKVREGRHSEVLLVPAARWTLGMNQSYEDPELRAFRDSFIPPHAREPAAEAVFPERDGKRNSPFGVPKQAVYKLSFYAPHGVPRELFSVRLSRKQPLEETPVYTPELKDLMDHFMEAPADLLHMPGTLGKNGMDSTLVITGTIPLGEHTELDFKIAVDIRTQSFTVLKADERVIQRQYLPLFRRRDFDPRKTQWFSQRYGYLLPALVAKQAKADAPVVLRGTDLSPLITAPGQKGPEAEVYSPVLIESREKADAIRGYLAQFLPHFKGFTQKSSD